MNKISCKYCGANAKLDWKSGSTLWFECGTMYKEVDQNREDQTKVCASRERDSLYKQIDNANECIKQLKEAGDSMLNAWLMPEDLKEYSDWIDLYRDAKSKWYTAKELLK
jgi:inorganic pyrophosphatase